MKRLINSFLLVAIAGYIFGINSCKSGGEKLSSKPRKQDSISILTSNINGTGRTIEVEMLKGKAHNHPTFVIWLEDSENNYIQTLLITKSIGQGVFSYGEKSNGKWKPGEVRLPAALPYWAHKRGIIAEDGLVVPSPRNKVPDAYTGATPVGSFKLVTKTDKPLKGKVKLIMEINQTWDWNEYWTNNLYPEDTDYKTSSQPALVYSTEIDLDSPASLYELKPIGHSHYSGKSGELFTDLSTITTALHIAETILVTVK